MAKKKVDYSHLPLLARCRPLDDRVIVKRDLTPSTTPGGIVLPDSAAAPKQMTGTVIRVGPGKAGTVMPVKAGDRVVITGYAGLVLHDQLGAPEQDEYVILRVDDVLAVIEE